MHWGCEPLTLRADFRFETSLQNQMKALIVSGTKSMEAGKYDEAVWAFRNAGMFGAQTLGPAIDAINGWAGAGTQRAWRMNAQLQAIKAAPLTTGPLSRAPSSLATPADAVRARQMAASMFDDYVNSLSARGGWDETLIP